MKGDLMSDMIDKDFREIILKQKMYNESITFD